MQHSTSAREFIGGQLMAPTMDMGYTFYMMASRLRHDNPPTRRFGYTIHMVNAHLREAAAE